MINIIQYKSLKKNAPHLVILGAIHGDEFCGTQAIDRIIQEFKDKQITLTHGNVTFIPICNPKAYEEKKRFIDRNLNRALFIKENPKAYEDFIDPILCPILETADYLLDLHSYASDGGPFAFIGTASQEEISYARHLGINHFVYGWADAYGKSDADPKFSWGTTEYARRFGAKAITVECGHHHNTDASDIGYQTIRHALDYLNMVEGAALPALSLKEQYFVQMHSVFFKEKEGEWLKPWQHYDHIAQGEVIAHYKDGEQIIAQEECYIILPKKNATIGKEWFYLGKRTECPKPD